MEVEDAEDDGALDCGGRVLLCIGRAADCEFLYLRDLLRRLRFGQSKIVPIYEDNATCIEWGNNVIGGHERAKHINIRKHFAPEVIQNGQMRLVKVPTSAQMADILTKGLHLLQVLACVDGRISGQPQARKRPLSTRGGGSPRLLSRVTSALMRGVSQTHCGPRPELEIDLIPVRAHLSPGNSEAGARPVG